MRQAGGPWHLLLVTVLPCPHHAVTEMDADLSVINTHAGVGVGAASVRSADLVASSPALTFLLYHLHEG